MADEEEEFFGTERTEAELRQQRRLERAVAEGEGRAQSFLRSALRCPVCDGLIATPRLKVHASCEKGTLVGKRCTCPPGCSDRAWGDQGCCAEGCVPCRMMHGQSLSKRGKR